MDRHHRRARTAWRPDVLKVREPRPEAPEQPWELHAHPDHLAAGVEKNRLDAVGHEFRMARHGGQPQAVVETSELREQRRHVALVAGAMATEDVGVENNERLAHPAAWR